MLGQQIVGATSLNAFKNGLDKLRKTKMGFFMDWSATLYASLVGMSCWWGHTRWVTKGKAAFYIVSVHQMAPPSIEVANI